MAYYPKRKAENASTDGNTSQKIKTSTSPTALKSTTTTNSATITNASLVESADFYIKDIEVKTYSGLKSLKSTIRTLSDHLRYGRTETQYYAFKSVPKKDALRWMDRDPSGTGHTRTTYFCDEEVMIVKLPSGQHEVMIWALAAPITRQFDRMGIADNQFVKMGATTIKRPRLCKEPDASFRPKWARPNMTDWPTLVIECGYAESLSQLRNDARLWITHSRGEASIVVIISIRRHSRALTIEKWYDQPNSLRRSSRLPRSPRDSPAKDPISVEVSHIPNTPLSPLASWQVVGAPMNLEFSRLYLRPAVPPEADVSLTAADFQMMASTLWD